MSLKDTINRFYFDMTINELRLMNQSEVFPNITYNSLLYLDIIAYTKNCTVSFIASAMNVAKSAVTLKVKELITMGLVEKNQSKEDKRVFYLTVKPEVIEEYKVYDKVIHDSLKAIEQKYSKEQIDNFCEMLNTLCESFSKGVLQK